MSSKKEEALPRVTISVDQSSYSRQELKRGIFVNYNITGTLPEAEYLISFVQKGAPLECEETILFNYRSGSGAIKLSPVSPGWDAVPWNKWPPKDKIADWDIALVKKTKQSLEPLCNTSLSISDLESRPQFTKVQYASGILSLEWTPESYTDFIITLTNKDGSMKLNQPATGDHTTIEKELDTQDTYIVEVTPLKEGAPQPAGDPRTVISAPPFYTGLSYSLIGSIGNLEMGWDAVANAEAYITTVNATDGSYHTNIPSTAPDCQLGKNLGSTLNYEVATLPVSSDGVVIGPSNSPLTAIVAQPEWSLLRYGFDGEQGTLEAQWQTTPHADQYSTTVESTDGTYKKEFPSEDPNVDIEESLDPEKVFHVTVQAKSKDDVIKGPESNTLTPILQRPELTLLSYSLTAQEGSLETNWQDLSDVQVYITTVESTDGSFKTNIPSTAPSSVLDKTLDSSKTYNVMVSGTAQNGIVQGPCCVPLTPILETASDLMLNYTGSRFLANWNLPSTLTGKSSETELYKDTIKVQTGSTTDTRQLYDITLENDCIYEVRAHLVDGVIKGPWTELSQGPYGVSITYTYDPMDRIKSIIWGTKLQTDYTIDLSGNVEAITVGAVSSAQKKGDITSR